MPDLPDAHFGTAETPLPDWREIAENDVDDEELPETPPDIIKMLGFDPLDLADVRADDFQIIVER